MFDEHPLPRVVAELMALPEDKRQLLIGADLPRSLHVAFEMFWRWTKASLRERIEAMSRDMVESTLGDAAAVCAFLKRCNVDSMTAVKGALLYLALRESASEDVADVKVSELYFYREEDDDCVKVAGKLVF